MTAAQALCRRPQRTASRRCAPPATPTIAQLSRGSHTAGSFTSRLAQVRTWRELDGQDVVIELGGAPLTVEVAVSAPRRARGLGGVERLASDRGMLFVHRQSGRQSYWMKDMRFAIDVIWCQGERVVEVTPAVTPPAPGSIPAEPPMVRSRRDADVVIEVPAGWAEAHGVRAGSTLRVV